MPRTKNLALATAVAATMAVASAPPVSAELRDCKIYGPEYVAEVVDCALYIYETAIGWRR